MKFTLKEMAESGYIMGLATIGEVATHMDLHYDAYFSIEQFTDEINEFNALIAGHLDDPIEMYVTDEEKKKIDEEMEAAFRESPGPTLEEFDQDCEAFMPTKPEKS